MEGFELWQRTHMHGCLPGPLPRYSFVVGWKLTRIAGNSGEVLIILVIWEFGIDCQIKNSPIELNAYGGKISNCQILTLPIPMKSYFG